MLTIHQEADSPRGQARRKNKANIGAKMEARREITLVMVLGLGPAVLWIDGGLMNPKLSRDIVLPM